ncbi:hypothetical protein BZG36_04668 [Bifiguratus adelaidae]|uniref:Mitochondrial outer membrane protein porin n=1 Tax=Bifiguratus adelaidae TaxID=1938954 RepID=A0A261XWJ6_9FUNG|nr:hypothetical protein BZG36_04668 [Bifiguratus adelaidae]
MAIPIPYNDIGKLSRDLLSKDFTTSGTRLEVKTTAPNGVTFKLGGSQDAKSGFIYGDLETKYTDRSKGVSITETWTTRGQLFGKIELDNNLAKGLKLDLTTSLSPATGLKNAAVGITYRQPNLHSVAHVDLLKSHVSVDTVIGHQGLLLGAEVGYDLPSGQVTRYNSAIGYSTPDYAVALHATSALTIFSVSFFHRLDKDTEAGGRVLYDSKADQMALEVGAKYRVSPDAILKAKVNNLGVLALGFTQLLRPGVKINLGSMIDTARIGEVGPKMGLSFTFEN